MARAYERSHPWLSFRLPDLTGQWRSWQRFGEAASKCEHLAGVPISPRVARELGAIYLAKGAHATTAIEGNTLSEDVVLQLAQGKTGVVPRSLEYQAVEVRNVLDVLRAIDSAMEAGRRLPLDPERMGAINAAILAGTDIAEDVTPGRVRTHEVTVGGSYRGAPAADCQHLLRRLCEWLNGPEFETDDAEQGFALALTKAVMAHVYLAWIHPFGDGNGRTARVIEAQILSQSGLVPQPATNLLSDHYNRTRGRYYRLLHEASRSSPAGDARPLLAYAAEGFADGLREQIARIREEQMKVAWVTHVYSTMDGQPKTATTERRGEVVLALPSYPPVPTSKIRELTARIALIYANKSERSLIRDLAALRRLDLVTHHGHAGWTSNRRTIQAFLPPIFDQPGGQSS